MAEKLRNSIRYSQNFVRSSELVAALLDKTSITNADTVLEIGPGTGLITAELAKRCHQVIAVEADRSLYDQLMVRFDALSQVQLISGDFLAQPLPAGPFKVFSNIPFNITADIVRKLLESNHPPTDTYLFVQQEAVMKLSGAPVGAQETQFSVLTKPWFEYRIIHRFNNTYFQPPPAVEVVLLQIKQRTEALIKSEQTAQYRDFIVYAFNSKKSTLKQGLEPVLTHRQFKRLAQDLHFDLSATPSKLGFEQWLGLFKYFVVGVSDAKKQTVTGAEAELKGQQAKLDRVHRTRTAADWPKLTKR